MSRPSILSPQFVGGRTMTKRVAIVMTIGVMSMTMFSAVATSIADHARIPPATNDSGDKDAIAELPDASEDQIVVVDDPHAEVRGMTISCHSWGWEWGTDEMVDSMRDLKALGINWIAIHPYGTIRADGAILSRQLQAGAPTPDWIARPIKEAHALGMKIMIKPHIAYWGSPFSWRGAIEFETQEQWDTFFASYDEWISTLATMSEGADAFVVGTELDKTINHESAWREIISSIRSKYTGPITYAANWDSYRNIAFWDAVDVIGIQAYFPLLPLETWEPGANPTDDVLRASWIPIVQDLVKIADQTGKRVVFTELGYNRSSKAPYEPWSSRSGGENAEDIQARCLNIAMQVIAEEPTVTGAFLWKWFPGSEARSNFRMADSYNRDVIESNWLRSPVDSNN